MSLLLHLCRLICLCVHVSLLAPCRDGPVVPISLAQWLQTDQVQTLMGEVFEKPLLDHLNGELCPLPRVAPLAPSTRMPAPGSILAPSYIPGSEANRVALGVLLPVRTS